MKTFLAALALTVLALVTPAHASSPPAPVTEPPPFIVPEPAPTAAPNPASDLDRLMRLLDEDKDEKKAPKLECTSKPCVFGYRFSDSVTSESVEKLEKFMAAAVEAKADGVMLEINTPGGSLSAGHEMSRIIEHSPLTVACVVDGKAYSMGMYILQSCDIRVMTKRSTLMVHQVSIMVRGDGTRLTQSGIDEIRVQIVATTRGYIEWVAHRMKLSVADVLKKVDNGGEWFLNWEEAVKVGAVDRAIDGPPEAYFQLLRRGQR